MAGHGPAGAGRSHGRSRSARTARAGGSDYRCVSLAEYAGRRHHRPRFERGGVPGRVWCRPRSRGHRRVRPTRPRLPGFAGRRSAPGLRPAECGGGLRVSFWRCRPTGPAGQGPRDCCLRCRHRPGGEPDRTGLAALRSRSDRLLRAARISPAHPARAARAACSLLRKPPMFGSPITAARRRSDQLPRQRGNTRDPRRRLVPLSIAPPAASEGQHRGHRSPP